MNMENITSYLSRNAEKYPDKAAIVHPVTMSFHELDKEIDFYAAGLREKGLGKGSRAILLVSSGPEFFIICFALLRIGAVPVMIDPGIGVKAMVKALSVSGAEAFIGVPRSIFLNYLYPEEFKSVRVWISTGKFKIPGVAKSSDLRLANQPFELPCKLNPDDIAGIFYTSGSTGPPKAVIYHAGTMDAVVRLMENHFHYTEEDIDLCTFPLLGLFVTCLGSSLVIADMNPIRPAKLDPQKIVDNLNRFGCTQMFGSPMILRKLVSYSENHHFRFSSLTRVISAGAPVPVELARSFSELCEKHLRLHTPYGSTEALPVSDLVHGSPEYVITENDYAGGICVGFPLPGVKIRIIRIEDNPVWDLSEDLYCQTDEVGEIIVSGPHITTKYIDDDANEHSKISGDDGSIWHRMGDLGRIDPKGRLWFYGRKNHRVVCRDRLLFTIPVEAIFNIHPDVTRTALVGMKIDGAEYAEAVLWIEAKNKPDNDKKAQIIDDMRAIAAENGLTGDIREFLFHREFPVDPRHNAKIYREKLAREAERRLK